MKKFIQIKRLERGFTLLEVIITIIIVAILGSFLITFMGTAITKSSDPIFQAQNRATAEGAMEAIVAAYAAYSITARSTTEWGAFKTTAAPVTTQTISDFLSSGFEAIEVTVTGGNQTFVSYYTR